MSGLASRLLDAALEDGDMRGPLSGMFPVHLPVPSFADALAPLSDKLPKVDPSKGQLAKMAWKKAGSIQAQFPSLTRDECAAVSLYTMEDMPRERSPYYVMNAALREKNRQAVRPWRDFVWLLLHALRKLPPSKARVVYRGMAGSELEEGAELQWSAFSSTATKVDVMEVFLDAEEATSGPRTMIHLELTEPVGRDVSAFSLYPQECEVLLPPNVCLEVVSRYKAGSGLVMVQCRQTESLDSLLDFGTDSKQSSAHSPAATEAAKTAAAKSLPGWGMSALWGSLWGNASEATIDEAPVGVVPAKAFHADADASIPAEVRKWVAQLRSGGDRQKEEAAGELAILANNNDDNKVAIARAGGIAPLVALARDGTDGQKEEAAMALGVLAENADNRVAITRAGGIAPLVALARGGTNGQKEEAAVALSILAHNADNKVAIAKAGGIPPLVALARGGTFGQKEVAAGTLGNLAFNADNQVAIARAGGIAPLVALARGGTDRQKEVAAAALRNLGCTKSMFGWKLPKYLS